MTATCSVTFEFELRAPVTWKGEVDGSAAHTIMHRATELATKELRPRNWSSAVAVILSRSGVEPESEPALEAPDAA